jgi:polysaccharide pyruvyl transferase WcaK-like protein
MQKTIRILHVASFNGNIGDNVSHIGLKNILSTLIEDKIEYTELEIRRFYNNYKLPDKLCFDEKFVDLANKFDLLIIGGGGFLDFMIENSETGTTINISRKNLQTLTVPTLITSVGCIPHKDVPDGNIEKFISFLQDIISQKNIFLTVRNDGSIKVLKELTDEKIWSKIPVILDNGFFCTLDADYPRIIDKPYVAVNTTLDQLKMKNKILSTIDYSKFLKEMVHFVMRVIKETDYYVVFVPHIYQDIRAIQEILAEVDDYYVRTRVVIAPYVHGEYGCKQILSVYKNAEYVIGMRFHSNISSLVMNKSISGLAALDRVIYLYDSFDGDDLVVPVDQYFADVLFNRMLVNWGKELPIDYRINITQKKDETLSIYKKILISYNLLSSC